MAADLGEYINQRMQAAVAPAQAAISANPQLQSVLHGRNLFQGALDYVKNALPHYAHLLDGLAGPPGVGGVATPAIPGQGTVGGGTFEQQLDKNVNAPLQPNQQQKIGADENLAPPPGVANPMGGGTGLPGLTGLGGAMPAMPQGVSTPAQRTFNTNSLAGSTMGGVINARVASRVPGGNAPGVVPNYTPADLAAYNLKKQARGGR